MSESLTLEPCGADADQAALVMGWRNDPVTLSMFYHRTPKTWPAFWDEWRQSYLPEDPAPVFACLDGRRVAFIRFGHAADPEGQGRKVIDISVNVDPARRGGGLGKRALQAAVRGLDGRGLDLVLAEVRIENVASQRAFLGAGFTLLDTIDKLIEDTGETCTIRRYLHAL